MSSKACQALSSGKRDDLLRCLQVLVTLTLYFFCICTYNLLKFSKRLKPDLKNHPAVRHFFPGDSLNRDIWFINGDSVKSCLLYEKLYSGRHTHLGVDFHRLDKKNVSFATSSPAVILLIFNSLHMLPQNMKMHKLFIYPRVET